MSDSPYMTIAAKTIGERYADLRIIQPVAENAMERSMQNYGQLTPRGGGASGRSIRDGRRVQAAAGRTQAGV
ncbi:hypothetical protein [Desulfosarcina variabilis]|uniref:hypothetical protein n=1 Tax=Desulfosarcina variabilis TaxID=2300 RepID=UPI003AFB069D